MLYQRLIIAISIVTLLVLNGPVAHSANTTPSGLPPGFTDTPIMTLSNGTDIAFTPDRRMLISSQNGKLYVLPPDQNQAVIALDLAGTICDNNERGLLGVAVDPNFEQNHAIYVYYSDRNGVPLADCPTSQTQINRVARYTLEHDNRISPNSADIIIDHISALKGNHNGSSMAFGADGYLYIAVGDAGTLGVLSQDLTKLNGKILRIDPNNAANPIPPDNPFANTEGARRCGDPAATPNDTGLCQEIFVSGLRNPWRMAFKPGTSQFYINDVGQGTWEEINSGLLGANYGWPMREGNCTFGSVVECDTPPIGLTNPLFSYDHTEGCSSITGGAFVPDDVWVAPYRGQYLFADVVCNRIFLLRPTPNGYQKEGFGAALGDVVTLKFAPNSGDLYYLTYSFSVSGPSAVRRIRYNGNGNAPPNASASHLPSYGNAPLTVTFDARQSTDPDNDNLNYAWQFGDGTRETAPNAAIISHTYQTNGVFIASLSVTDDKGNAAPTLYMRVDVGNTPPQPMWAALAPEQSYAVGQEVVLRASATDAEDGALPANRLTWRVLLHHVDAVHPQNAHTHPYVAPTMGSSISFTMPPPEDINALPSFLEVQLTATDSQGLAQTITRTIQPRRVNLALQSQPVGLAFMVNGYTFTQTQTFAAWQGYRLTLSAPSFQNVTSNANAQALFQRWHIGDGNRYGSNPYSFIMPATPVQVLAEYEVLNTRLQYRMLLPLAAR